MTGMVRALPWLLLPVLFVAGYFAGRSAGREVPPAAAGADVAKLRDHASRFTPECDALKRQEEWKVPFLVEVLNPDNVARILSYDAATKRLVVTIMDLDHRTFRETRTVRCEATGAQDSK